MKDFGTALGAVLVVTLLVAITAGGYFFFAYVVRVFGSLEPRVATLAAIASVVAILCAAIIGEGIKASGQRVLAAAFAAERVRLYERMLAICCADEAAEESERLALAIALQGDAKVVAAFVEFRKGDAAALTKLVGVMRRDLGRGEFVSGVNVRDLLDPGGTTTSARA